MSRAAKVRDCGRHGLLTNRQICERAGIGMPTLFGRIKDGWTGEKLLQSARAYRKNDNNKERAQPKQDAETLPSVRGWGW